ncbi:phosphodiester glycosidase family protein [Paenibacillus sp. NPDC056579]|uniref:phosphodiester glycosidase family protein n=1 Tax=Paenibacillus sp. NPDC056579 TaxID=3345871 RepID=UPI00367D4C6F
MQTHLNNGWRIVDEAEFQVSPGVRHFRQRLLGEQLLQSVHMIELDPAHEYVRLEPVSSSHKVHRLETAGNLMAELEQEGKRVIAGINGDFFSYAGVPSGLQMIDGEIITSPETIKVAMAVMRDGSVRLESGITMSAELCCENGYMTPVGMVNRAISPKQADMTAVYTWRYGSTNKRAGTAGRLEITVATAERQLTLKPGIPVMGIVQAIAEQCGEAEIAPGSWVISAAGSAAEHCRRHMQIGQTVTLRMNYNKDFNNAVHVLSGNSTLGMELLQDGIIPSSVWDPDVRLNSDRHPRTFLGTKGGKLYLFAVDGRSPGHSDGMTLAEQAVYLQQLGMEQAINLDGGGSTTCYLRIPGEQRAELINRPSDGFERKIGNALAVISSAPARELSELIVTPDPVRIIAGGRIAFGVKGHDRHLNAVRIHAADLHWSAEESIGTIDDEGCFTAGPKAASGQVIVRHGAVTRSVQVQVIDALARIDIAPSKAAVEPGGSCQLYIRAYDDYGHPIIVPNELVSWTSDESIGEMNASGVLQAVTTEARGTVTAVWGGLRARSYVQVGRPHRMIADFETLDGIRVHETGTVPGAVNLSKVARPLPVRFGTFSGRLTYEFVSGTENSHIRISMLNEQGFSGRLLDGNPIRFGLWVNGDRSGNGIKLVVEDSEGNLHSLPITGPAGLNWKGWKYVCAEVDPSQGSPLRVHSLILVGTPGAKPSGVIYLDHFRAEYTDFNEDVEGPTFDQMQPAENAEVTSKRPLLQVHATDPGSGVDPSSIRVWLNDRHIRHRYFPGTGRIECLLDTDLEPGPYQVTVEASDMERNAAVPACSWHFTVVG